MFTSYLWDTQKSIEAAEKEGQNTEEIKKDRKRNRLSTNTAGNGIANESTNSKSE